MQSICSTTTVSTCSSSTWTSLRLVFRKLLRQTFPGITRVNLHTKMAEMSQRIVASTWFQRFLWRPSSARSTLYFTTPTRWHRNAYFISSDGSFQRQPRQDLLGCSARSATISASTAFAYL